MYKFTDLNKTNIEDNYYYSAEVPIFEFGILDDLIQGFHTLNVEGRGLMGKDVKTSDLELIDGTKYRSANYKMRTIKINFLMLNESNSQLIENINMLNKYLSKDQITFRFKDEEKYKYTGTATIDSSIDSAGLNVLGNITILCNDPFKYSGVTTINNSFNFDFNMLSYTYDVNVKKIRFTAVNSVLNPIITVNYLDSFLGESIQYRIRVNKQLNSNDYIEFDFNNYIPYYNGSVDYSILMINSDFEEIKFSTETTIDAPNLDITITSTEKAI